jgi:hypothetical protein
MTDYKKLEERMVELLTNRLCQFCAGARHYVPKIAAILKGGEGDLYETLAEEFGWSREEAKARTFMAMYGGRIPDPKSARRREEMRAHQIERRNRLDAPRTLGPHHRQVCYRGADREVRAVSTSYSLADGGYGERIRFFDHGEEQTVDFHTPLTPRTLNHLIASRSGKQFLSKALDLGGLFHVDDKARHAYISATPLEPMGTETGRVPKSGHTNRPSTEVFDPVEHGKPLDTVACCCGGDKAGTPHATYCPKKT